MPPRPSRWPIFSIRRKAISNVPHVAGSFGRAWAPEYGLMGTFAQYPSFVFLLMRQTYFQQTHLRSRVSSSGTASIWGRMGVETSGRGCSDISSELYEWYDSTAAPPGVVSDCEAT